MNLVRLSVHEQIREVLLQRIGCGELAPGERIVESRLTKEFAVSAIPVREAIRELVAKGVLDSAAHKGAWVREVSVTETIEAFPLAAPTWWTLKELADHWTSEEVMNASVRRRAIPVQPILDVSEAGLEVWLPGHRRHDERAVEGLPTCIRMRAGAWQAI